MFLKFVQFSCISINTYCRKLHSVNAFYCGYYVYLQIGVMRPPNYTLLMIWLPVIVLAFIIGYLKRENLHMLYEPKYWAIAAMVGTYASH